MDAQSSEALEHQGVKGMKWGVRKAAVASIPRHADYTSSHRSRDRSEFSKNGIDRVNARMHGGMTHKEARDAERALQAKKRAIAIGVIATAKIVHKYGPVAVQAIQIQAHNNRQRSMTDHSPEAYERTVTPNKRGVHNITNLK